MRFLAMFVTAVCVLFLIKLRWPKKNNFSPFCCKFHLCWGAHCLKGHQNGGRVDINVRWALGAWWRGNVNWFWWRRRNLCYSSDFHLYEANKLSLNVTKTNFIIFHPYQKHLNHDVKIKILDNRVNKYFNLEHKEYVKYLGVMIDNHLSWKHHINYVALKISRNIGILSKLRHFVPPKTLFAITIL